MADNKIEFIIQGRDATKEAFKSLNVNLTSLKSAVVALGVGAFVRVTTQALDFASAIQDTATRLDISTDALQQWRFIAEQSGASAEKMDAAFGMFSRTIGMAAAGSGEAQRELARLGISLNDLNTQSPEQVFERTRDAISNMGSASERNRILMQLFGRQGKELGNVFAASSAEIDRMRMAAGQMGAVMDGETIAKAKEAKDKLDAMAAVIKVQLSTALIAVGPLLVTAATKLAELTKYAVTAAEAFSHFLGIDFAPSLDQYDKLLFRQQELEKQIKSLEGEGGFFRWLENGDARLVSLRAKLTEVNAELDGLRKKQALPAEAAPTAGGTQKIDPNYLLALKQQADTSSGIKSKALENDRANQMRKLHEMNLDIKSFREAEYWINQDYGQKMMQLRDETFTQLGAASDLYYSAERSKLALELQNMVEMGVARDEIQRYQAQQELLIESEKILARQELQRQDLEARLALTQNMTDREKEIERQALVYKQMNDRQKAASQREAFGQMLVDLGTFNKSAFKAAKAYNIGVAIMDTWTGFTKTLSAYPYPANIIFAAASLAAGMAKVNAIKSQQYTGQAHAGMTDVPREGTFLLDKGERVLAPEQNRDLTDFLSGGGGGVNVGSLNVYIDVPDSRALIAMDRNDWRDIVARNVIPALDALDRMGVRQVALERQRG